MGEAIPMIIPTIVVLGYPLMILTLFVLLHKIGKCPAWFRQYTRNVWVAVDQYVNAVLLGDEDETISSRVGKAARRGNKWPALIVDYVVFVLVGQRDHCTSCIEEDEGNNALSPPETAI